MSARVGDLIPDARLWRLAGGRPRPVPARELLAGKKAVVFAVPGAFTPTCSDDHLPGFVERAVELRAKGVDLIACLAVNDAWVMDAWGRAHAVGDRIVMLGDGNGELTRAMGLERDASSSGLGLRSQRWAAIVEDNRITALEVEPGPGVTVSGADAILARLS